MTIKKIYIIAGEASGDMIGAHLIRSLRKLSKTQVDFYGIGGFRMEKEGFASSFPMSEISLFGIIELLPHILNLIKRIKQTIAEIKSIKPDILITIDSPGFCTRVAKKLTGLNLKIVHYVAPTVWAREPDRAKKFALIYDHIFLLFNFEKKYFDAVNLPNTYVGSPILEENINLGNGKEFRKKHNIPDNKFIICVIPGTRNSEIKYLLPVLIKTLKKLESDIKDMYIAIPTTPQLSERLKKIMDKTSLDYLIIDSVEEKKNLYNASNLAISKIGTSNIELALTLVPMVIGYKINYITALLLRFVLNIKFFCIFNIIMNKEIIPEFVQNKFTPNNLYKEIVKLLNDKNKIQEQLKETEKAKKELFGDIDINLEENKPSYIAAKTILDIIKD